MCIWLQAATDLDSIIAAHSQYLSTMLSKALLSANVASDHGKISQQGLQGHLHSILQHMLDLKAPMLRLSEAVSPCDLYLCPQYDYCA